MKAGPFKVGDVITYNHNTHRLFVLKKIDTKNAHLKRYAIGVDDSNNYVVIDTVLWVNDRQPVVTNPPPVVYEYVLMQAKDRCFYQSSGSLVHWKEVWHRVCSADHL